MIKTKGFVLRGFIMLEWKLDYNIATIIISVMLLAWYLHQKKIPLSSYVFFLKFNLSVLACTIIESIGVTLFKSGIIGEFGFNVFMAFYSFIACLITVIYACFVFEYMHVSDKNKKFLKIFLYIILTITMIIDAATPFTKIGFYFYNNEYVFGKFGGLYALLSGVAVVTGIAVIIVKRKQIPASRVYILIASIVFSTLMFVVQLKFTISILCFGYIIVCLTLYNYIFNPALYIDNLTQLYNKDCMREYLEYRLERNKQFSIILVAMDDFKYINKTYGVDIGDNLLVQVGNYLRGVDGVDEVFGYGSDQFGVVCNKKSVEDAKLLAGIIEERFKHPWYSESAAGVMMSSSSCCFECPKDADNYGNLVEIMDYAMSMAKKTNKGGISVAGEMDLTKMRSEKEIEKAVKLAIDRDELMVYYQPIFSVGKNLYNSAEALVRLNDEKLGWISPEVFIPIAEKNGLIISLGDQILRSVCKFIHDNKLAESSIEYIEVNISPVQLQQPEYYKKVIAILEEYEVKPSQINIEITETANMVGGSEIVNENIKKIVEYGITLSLDDYGSGYSNLDYINHMPFHIIKIDKYIVWDAFENIKAGITLEYTIRMLNALNYMIVAEGVETKEQKDHLAEIGCHYMQGWYYSKAVAEDEFMQTIKKIPDQIEQMN